MRDRDLLFFEEDLDAQLRARQQSVSVAVDGIAKDQFLVSNDQEILDHVVSSLTVEPVSLREDAMTMNQQETHIDVSRDQMRYFSPGRSGPFYIPGTRVDIDIPFIGEEWIFRYRTNPWSTVFPRAEVQRGHLRLSISQPHDADPASFKSIYEREIKLIREYVDRAHKQVVAYNESLPNLVQQAVNHRRDRLGRHGNIAALLDIPLATRPGAPSIAPRESGDPSSPDFTGAPEDGACAGARHHGGDLRAYPALHSASGAHVRADA